MPNRSRRNPPRPGHAAFAATGAMLGLAATALLHRFALNAQAMPPLIAAFGASAVVLHGLPDSDAARPRNAISGSLIAAFLGVLTGALADRFLPGTPGWMLAIAVVPASIFAMALTDTMHPPAGALAFIAVAGPPEIRQLGWLYPLMPVATGVGTMLATAWLMRRVQAAGRWHGCGGEGSVRGSDEAGG